MDPLKTFYDNTVLKEALYNYLEAQLERMIIDRAFSDGYVQDIAEARKVIRKAFDNLEGKYAEKKVAQNPSQ